MQASGSHLNSPSLSARMQGGEKERPPVQGPGDGAERCPSGSLARKEQLEGEGRAWGG